MNEDFDAKLVKTWVRAAKEGRQRKWIAEELRTTYAYVKHRGEHLRSIGVELPHLLHGNQKKKPDEIEGLRQLLHNEGTSDHPDVTGEN